MPYWRHVKPPMYWLVGPKVGEGILAQFNPGRYVVEVFLLTVLVKAQSVPPCPAKFGLCIRNVRFRSTFDPGMTKSSTYAS